ncbi:hypothetical protein R1flu_014715 [Riccia fluitans]|uniref:Uncharacterized protein n=1 Tax=Riccia fluitans TaxID=41844 RepID=A0ABD1YI05_9MARC
MYNVAPVVNKEFFLDEAAYNENGPASMSFFMVFSFGLGFATVTATIMHFALFHDKAYGYNSMQQALSFNQDFKLGLYMKVPPRSLFIVQVVATIVAAIVNTGVYWWMLTSMKNIRNVEQLPSNSPWTCPSDQALYSYTSGGTMPITMPWQIVRRKDHQQIQAIVFSICRFKFQLSLGSCLLHLSELEIVESYFLINIWKRRHHIYTKSLLRAS